MHSSFRVRLQTQLALVQAPPEAVRGEATPIAIPKPALG